MNGAQHYRTAEQLVERADRLPADDAIVMISEAQVHATLALAAATLVAGQTKSFTYQEMRSAGETGQ